MRVTVTTATTYYSVLITWDNWTPVPTERDLKMMAYGAANVHAHGEVTSEVGIYSMNDNMAIIFVNAAL